MIKQLYHFSMNGSKGTNIIHNEFPLVSIVIPHFNGEEILLDCLKSLKKSNYPNLEIIVVDNGSSDNSIKVVREKFSNIELKDYGFSYHRDTSFPQDDITWFLLEKNKN